MARSRAVAAAVVRRAQVRAAFENLARNFYLRLAEVVACSLWSAARIFRHAARLRRIGLVPGRPPVRGPFPDVADHVVKPVTVGRKSRYGRGPLVAVLIEVLAREFALPGIRRVRATG